MNTHEDLHDILQESIDLNTAAQQRVIDFITSGPSPAQIDKFLREASPREMHSAIVNCTRYQKMEDGSSGLAWADNLRHYVQFISGINPDTLREIALEDGAKAQAVIRRAPNGILTDKDFAVIAKTENVHTLTALLLRRDFKPTPGQVEYIASPQMLESGILETITQTLTEDNFGNAVARKMLLGLDNESIHYAVGHGFLTFSPENVDWLLGLEAVDKDGNHLWPGIAYAMLELVSSDNGETKAGLTADHLELIYAKAIRLNDDPAAKCYVDDVLSLLPYQKDFQLTPERIEYMISRKEIMEDALESMLDARTHLELTQAQKEALVAMGMRSSKLTND